MQNNAAVHNNLQRGEFQPDWDFPTSSCQQIAFMCLA
jgi:hypothetical protein